MAEQESEYSEEEEDEEETQNCYPNDATPM